MNFKKLIKKTTKLLLIVSLIVTNVCSVFAKEEVKIEQKQRTIINVPLDSRPISLEYLENLASINNDKVLSISKNHLDKMENGLYTTGNTFLIRQEFSKLAKENNEIGNMAIINMSSYFFGGVIASRNSQSYQSFISAYNSLKKDITTYDNIKYYINLNIPRTLPEDRAGVIWKTNNKLKGLGAFYLKYNINTLSKDIKTFINNHYKKVDTNQFLMEYSYVLNKQQEGYPLTNWENEYLTYAKQV